MSAEEYDECWPEDEDTWDEDEEFDCDEPIGSCDECATNLYEDDCWEIDGEELCGQCYWWRTQAHK